MRVRVVKTVTITFSYDYLIPTIYQEQIKKCIYNGIKIDILILNQLKLLLRLQSGLRLRTEFPVKEEKCFSVTALPFTTQLGCLHCDGYLTAADDFYQNGCATNPSQTKPTTPVNYNTLGILVVVQDSFFQNIYQWI